MKIAFIAIVLALDASQALYLGIRAPLCNVAHPSFAARSVIEMGRGDKRTQAGKRKAKSFGNSRKRNSKLRRERYGPITPPAEVDSAKATVAAFEEAANEEAVVSNKAKEAAAEVTDVPALSTPEEPEVAPALKPAEIAACVKQLRMLLPRADLKVCKEAVVAAGGDVELAKAQLLADYEAEWEAQDAAEAAELAEGLAASQALKEAKALKKFEKEEAAKAAAAAVESEHIAEEPGPTAIAETVEVVESELILSTPEAPIRLPNADDLGRVWVR